MNKNIKFLTKKFFSLVMIVAMTFQTIAPTMVYAISCEDGNSITIGGSPTINGSTFEYEHGDVTITKNGESVNTTSFSVAQNDAIVITLTADTGYNYSLHNNVRDFTVELTGNSYSFTIGQASESALSFTPLFNSIQQNPGAPSEPPQDSDIPSEPTIEAMKFDFTFNGSSFTNVSIGDQLIVPDNFNMDSITEFYVTKIAIEGDRTYTYAANEYSYALLDNQERHVFEAHFNKKSNALANLRIEAHINDLLEKDIAQGKTREDYFGFYITGITFIKSGFRGVEFSTNVMPDNYDFTVWNGADLSATTKDNPGIVTAYYGESTIGLESSVSSKITEIKLTEDSGIPSSAISINNETGEVTILSNYYNEIPLQVKLEDGTVGYVKINRIGIFVGLVDSGNNTFYHGASAMVSGNLNVDTDKNRIAAVFYHEDTTTYNDYDLIVNLTFEDGKTETVTAQGVGDIRNSNGNIIGSDYILWKGDSLEEAPKQVSVTAVKKGAITNETKFGGATFGSGAGVIWKRK